MWKSYCCWGEQKQGGNRKKRGVKGFVADAKFWGNEAQGLPEARKGAIVGGNFRGESQKTREKSTKAENIKQ